MTRIERKADPRQRVRVMVRYGVDKLEKMGFSMNLSSSGAFIRTNSVYKPGTRLQVEFELKDEKVSLWAQVVWAKKVPPQLAHTLTCGMGVRFLNTDDAWSKAFERWKQSR